MSDYKFSMPWAPSVNGYWRTFRNRQIISKRGREYRLAVIRLCKILGIEDELVEGKLSVNLILNPPTLRRYDVDNFSKALFDGLTSAGFWIDDEQVHKLTISKGEKVKGGRVDVTVTIID